MSTGGSIPPKVRVQDGTIVYEFFDDSSFKSFLSQQEGSYDTIFESTLKEFKSLPQIDDVLIRYFEESIKCCVGKQSLAGSILIGCLSELLILRLLKTIGIFLDDPNAIDNYESKHKYIQKQFSYTKQLVKTSREKLRESRALSQTEESTFKEFEEIVIRVFDSIRLRRNEYVHPKVDMDFNDLPDEDVILSVVYSFNPYAKAILKLIDLLENE